jgi:hypothetical protein
LPCSTTCSLRAPSRAAVTAACSSSDSSTALPRDDRLQVGATLGAAGDRREHHPVGMVVEQRRGERVLTADVVERVVADDADAADGAAHLVLDRFRVAACRRDRRVELVEPASLPRERRDHVDLDAVERAPLVGGEPAQPQRRGRRRPIRRATSTASTIDGHGERIGQRHGASVRVLGMGLADEAGRTGANLAVGRPGPPVGERLCP